MVQGYAEDLNVPLLSPSKVMKNAKKHHSVINQEQNLSVSVGSDQHWGQKRGNIGTAMKSSLNESGSESEEAEDDFKYQK